MKPHKLNAARVRSLIPQRPAISQKGNNGHVLLVTGSRGMAGAAILSGLGALRSGAGLLTIGIVAGERRIVTSRLPEAMTLPLPESGGGHLAMRAAGVIRQYVRRRKITTLAVGPGLGVGAPQKALVLDLIRQKLPIVLDADALNNLSAKALRPKGPAIITPHPGELARLLGETIKEVQKDRVKCALDTAKRLNVICVLKGHQTVVSDGVRTYLNTTGNSAMATGGMGDVLTGVIAGFLAQGLSSIDAACAGVYLHGLAADLARVSDRGLLATEVAALIPYALKKIGIR
jgi:NAD(P)H-hydrate epimerase